MKRGLPLAGYATGAPAASPVAGALMTPKLQPL